MNELLTATGGSPCPDCGEFVVLWQEHRCKGRGTISPLLGWQCPKCKRVYAPSQPECFHCNTKVAEQEGLRSESRGGNDGTLGEQE